MANPGHLEIIKQGVEVWNRWREEHPRTQPDLRDAYLRGIVLNKANLSTTNMRNADLIESDLGYANLTRANLTGARLNGAKLLEANLAGTYLSKADLTGANLTRSDLSKAIAKRANLTDAKLVDAKLVETDLGRANLTGANLSRANMKGCFIYAIAAWDVRLENTNQTNLVITRLKQPTITVDNLEVAQFIYLLLNNPKIRSVIDTITSKVVLILGRFVDERKQVLDALRDELRKRNYSPVLFDFEKPASRDITETVSTLAHMARFVIADITDAKSIPQELMAIVPSLPSVPVQPLILESQREYAMFEHFTMYPWVLPIYHYTDQAHLLATLKKQVIDPAERKAHE